MQITTANTPYVGTINFMVNSVCPYPMLDFTSLIHIYQQYYLGETPSYLGEASSYLGEAPSYFGGSPSYLGEALSYFGEGRNIYTHTAPLASKKGARL